MAEAKSSYIIAQATDAAGTVAPTAQPGPTTLTPQPVDAGSDALAPVDVAASPVGADPLEFFGYDLRQGIDLIEKGGPVVMILLVISVIAVTVTIVKILQFALSGVGSTSASNRSLKYWIDGRRQDALTVVKASKTPTAVVLAHGMRGVLNGADERTVREDAERVALGQLSGLRSYMRVLDSTVQIAPLIGLFGTVLGMISAFQALQSAGAEADPTVLAGGIWVALMTTAAGLAIAIPMAFVNTWLEGRIEREKENMESALTSMFTMRATEGLTPVAANDTGARIAHAAE